MLAFFRIITYTIACIIVTFLGLFISLFRPGHANNTYIVARILTMLTPILGVKVEVRRATARDNDRHIFICNHQSNYDVAILPFAIEPGTVGVGKKSLRWVPFLGLLFWITGNIFIDRKKTAKAKQTISALADKVKHRNVSIWMFPEGTRSKGRGLLPFKMGAFHLAIDTGKSVVPIVCSNLYNKINLNRWNNGLIIIEMLAPIAVDNYTKDQVKVLADKCHELMQTKQTELNQEVIHREQNKQI